MLFERVLLGFLPVTVAVPHGRKERLVCRRIVERGERFLETNSKLLSRDHSFAVQEVQALADVLAFVGRETLEARLELGHNGFNVFGSDDELEGTRVRGNDLIADLVKTTENDLARNASRSLDDGRIHLRHVVRREEKKQLTRLFETVHGFHEHARVAPVVVRRATIVCDVIHVIHLDDAGLQAFRKLEDRRDLAAVRDFGGRKVDERAALRTSRSQKTSDRGLAGTRRADQERSPALHVRARRRPALEGGEELVDGATKFLRIDEVVTRVALEIDHPTLGVDRLAANELHDVGLIPLIELVQDISAEFSSAVHAPYTARRPHFEGHGQNMRDIEIGRDQTIRTFDGTPLDDGGAGAREHFARVVDATVLEFQTVILG